MKICQPAVIFSQQQMGLHRHHPQPTLVGLMMRGGDGGEVGDDDDDHDDNHDDDTDDNTDEGDSDDRS